MKTLVLQFASVMNMLNQKSQANIRISFGGDLAS